VKPSTETIPVDALLKRLHLANARRIYRDLIARAEQEQWSFDEFLAVLVAEEVAHRQQTRIQRLTRRADFPFLKTIEEFDFTYQSTLRLSLLGSALSPDFVAEGRCLILSGKSGRGKTHLAVAIAYRAIQNGFEAFFTTAAKLIDDLSGASREGRLREALVRYTHPHLLVIDEVGYLGYGDDAANVLFHVVNDRHLRKRSMVFTTNKALGSWGRVLHDPDLAAAIVDRILERGRLIPLDGPSLRTRHLGLDDPTDPEASLGHARISGIDRPEFPEPTLPGEPGCPCHGSILSRNRASGKPGAVHRARSSTSTGAWSERRCSGTPSCDARHAAPRCVYRTAREALQALADAALPGTWVTSSPGSHRFPLARPYRAVGGRR
jgi:DNA replication protein DnaC